VVLLQVHQRLFTPPATDEQMQQTQNIMKYATLFIGLLFFKVPAGLCLYFITSSLWSIVERKLMPKTTKPATPGDEKTGATKSYAPPTPSGNGAGDKARQSRKQKKR
jgi:YidC/Oxa1 family membrane protein insertase